jgi:hypothetical protein
MREVLCYKHYSLNTEQAYLYWIRLYVRWHGMAVAGRCGTRAPCMFIRKTRSGQASVAMHVAMRKVSKNYRLYS